MQLSEKVKEEIIRKGTLCLTDLFYLVTEIIYWPDKHKYGDLHRWMCKTVSHPTLQKVEGFKYPVPLTPSFRELFLLPRDHFKSSIFTVGHLVQQILCNPGQSFLISSSKDEHAKELSKEVRRQFVFNERLLALFPEFKAQSEDAMGGIETWTVPARAFYGKRRKEPTVTVVSFKGRKESKHYRGLYLDDCQSEEDTSEAGLAEVRENFKSVVPLVDKDGFILMMGTRKHYLDLYQLAMDTEMFKVYVRHGLEGEKQCEADECARYAEPHKVADLKTGTPLEPLRMDRKDYEVKLRLCESDPKMGQSYFWHEYMNIPFAPTERRFQPSWFVKVDDGMIPGSKPPFSPLQKWIAIDTALKDEEHPSGYDFSVVVVGGFDEMGRLYILDIFRDRTWTEKNVGDTVITCMKTAEYGGISRIITEKVGEVRLNNYLRERARLAGIPMQIVSLTRGGKGAKSKFERIVGTQGYFEQGRVFFRRSVENFDDCVNEFCNLGRWTNDDIADAISMFFDEQAKVMAPSQVAAKPYVTPFRPMPYEGGFRRAMFSQSHRPVPSAAQFGRNGQVAVDMSSGNVMFTPEQVDLFANRPDKQPQTFKPGFRKVG